MTNNYFGEYLRQLREAKGLTQTQLANKTGINQSTISGLERGHQYQTTHIYLQRLAEALDTPVEELTDHMRKGLEGTRSLFVMPKRATPPKNLPSEAVMIDYDTAREILDLIEWARGGHEGTSLTRIALRLTRQMPEEEIPPAFGGSYEPEEE